MRRLLSEKNIVIVLFVLVFIIFSFAENETKKIEQLYNGGNTSIKNLQIAPPEVKAKVPTAVKSSEIKK